MRDPEHSTIGRVKLIRTIIYAVNDVLAVTYLHRPVERQWTLSTANRRVVFEEEADDQLIGPIDQSNQVNQDNASNEPSSRRSLESRKRRNQHRNRIRRVLRDRHLMVRNIYHRFNVKQVEEQLKHLQIKNVHLRLDKVNRCLYIGLKRPDRIEQYFDLIPGDLFGRRHYQQSYARREKQMVPLKSKRFFRIMQNDCFRWKITFYYRSIWTELSGWDQCIISAEKWIWLRFRLYNRLDSKESFWLKWNSIINPVILLEFIYIVPFVFFFFFSLLVLCPLCFFRCMCFFSCSFSKRFLFDKNLFPFGERC